MKKLHIVLFIVFYSLSSCSLASSLKDKQNLINQFHKFGIVKCDKFILENSKLEGNWYYFIDRYGEEETESPVREVSLIRIYGKKGDSIKVDDSYIQSSKYCYLHSRTTLTFSGACASNMNGDYWYVSNQMPENDYTTYKNRNGVEMHVKDISVGNFKACIEEVALRKRVRVS